MSAPSPLTADSLRGTPPSPLRRRWAGLRRVVLTWRRPLAAVLAAVAVLAGVQAATAPPAPSREVVVAARDLPGGRPLTSDDLGRHRLPVEAVPAGAVSDPTSLLGRTLAAPVRRGEAVTDVRVVGEGLLAGYPMRVASPVRIGDAAVAGLLRVGDRVDVVATDPGTGKTRVVSQAAPVIALPRERGNESTAATGLAGGALVVVAVPPDTAVELAGAAAGDLLSVILAE
jgi:Flp pilus assembly protein CpaB